MLDFTGKVAFVTGIAHGIGRAIAEGFAKGHACLAIADIDPEGLKRTEELVRSHGARVIGFPLDVSDEDAVKAAVDETVRHYGKIDILVNNAGIYNDNRPFDVSEAASWKRKIDVNLYGTLFPTRAALPYMLERRYGRIVNIGSVAGVYGIGGMSVYSLTKGGVIAFTRALAKETTAKGVNVNCVSPGSIGVTDKETMPEHAFMGRSGTPEECANVVLFLSSDEASYVSGQNYQVDGCRKRM